MSLDTIGTANSGLTGSMPGGARQNPGSRHGETHFGPVFHYRPRRRSPCRYWRHSPRRPRANATKHLTPTGKGQTRRPVHRSPQLARITQILALGGILSSLAPTNAASFRLIGGIVHTVSGATLTNAPVLVRDGRIQAVGALATGTVDREVDLGGQHLYPGLIAPTTVLGLVELDGVRATRDSTEVGEFTPEVNAWVAVNPDSELIPVARANGYTHAQVVPLGGTLSGVSGVVQLRGWTTEELTVKRAAALHLFWPSFELDLTPKHLSPSRDKWKSPEDQVRDRNRRLRELDAFFSEAQAYARAREVHAPSQATVPAWEAMVPLVRGELPLWIHADELRQIRSAIEWAAQRRFTTVLAGGRDAWRCADLLASNRVAVAYEHVFTLPPRDSDTYDVQYAAPALLFRAGVQVAFTEGTDRFGASGIRNIPYAAAQAMAFGLPPDEAIRGLTLYPARMLGLADRLGSIEPGRDATFIAVDGSLLDIRRRVTRMWIRGEETSLESRHTRLYERYRQRPRNP